MNDPQLTDHSQSLALLAADVTRLWNSHTAFRQETNARFDQLTVLVEQHHDELRGLFEDSRAELLGLIGDVRDQVRLVTEGHSVLATGQAQLRSDMNDRHSELRDMMAFMHKDLCARIDARNGTAGTPPP